MNRNLLLLKLSTQKSKKFLWESFTDIYICVYIYRVAHKNVPIFFLAITFIKIRIPIHKLLFRYHPQKTVRPVEILGMEWPGVIGLMQNESVSWEVTRDVFKWFAREMRWHLIFWTEHLNTSGITYHETDSFQVKPIIPGHPISKISTLVTISWGRYLKVRVCENRTQTKEDIIRRKIRWIAQEMLKKVVDNFNVRVAAVLSTSARCIKQTNY